VGDEWVCKLNCQNYLNGIGTMIGVFMFWKGLSVDDVSSSGDGLLEDEPILKKLT
jgi:hypothetical protein